MFKDRILDILKLAFDISTNSKDDVFVNYSPHCSLVSIQLHEGGWESSKDSDITRWDIYFDVTRFRSEDYINSAFDEVISTLSSKLLIESC